MLSVVVSAYNEERRLPGTIDTILRAHDGLEKLVPIEIIVIDDGSQDSTRDVAQRLGTQLADRGYQLKVVAFDNNQGVGAGFLAGVDEAAFSKVTVLPGDNSLAAQYIRSIFLHTPHCENLFSFIENSQKRGVVRSILSRFHHILYRVGFSLPIQYVHGTPVYQKELIRKLHIRSRRYCFFTELAVKALRSGIRYTEISGPVVSEAEARKSSALNWRTLNEVVMTYLSLLMEVHITNRRNLSGIPERQEPVDVLERKPLRLDFELAR